MKFNINDEVFVLPSAADEVCFTGPILKKLTIEEISAPSNCVRFVETAQQCFLKHIVPCSKLLMELS